MLSPISSMMLTTANGQSRSWLHRSRWQAWKTPRQGVDAGALGVGEQVRMGLRLEGRQRVQAVAHVAVAGPVEIDEVELWDRIEQPPRGFARAVEGRHARCKATRRRTGWIISGRSESRRSASQVTKGVNGERRLARRGGMIGHTCSVNWMWQVGHQASTGSIPVAAKRASPASPSRPAAPVSPAR